MTPLRLTSWFRRRMLALVVGASAASALAPPLAYHLQKRHELASIARADAERVSAVVAAHAEARPRLWRYDATKLSERLANEGLGSLPALVVHDGRGARVLSQPAPAGKGGEASGREAGGREASGRDLVWGRREIRLGGKPTATVWVAAETGPLWVGTLAIAAASTLVAVLLGAVLYLLPVRAIAQAERRISALMGQLALTLQEEERGRIARDLHDGAGQALTAARLHLLALRRASPDAGARIDAIASHLDEALDEVRRSTAALMPPALAELGLRGALARHCDAVAQAAGIEVSCEVADDLPPLEAHVETACYRIVQEALTNTARHAGATRAWVRLSAAGAGAGAGAGEAVSLEIGDDGQGLAPDRALGSGLESIAERARLLGGGASFDGEGPGLRVKVILPLPEGTT